jgi:hypothetical protein
MMQVQFSVPMLGFSSNFFTLVLLMAGAAGGVQRSFEDY